jgi:hypothetical protein
LGKYLTYFLAIFLSLLIFSMPVCFATEVNNAYKTTSTDTNTSNPERQQKAAAIVALPFVGLAAPVVAALIDAGIYYIAIGGAVLLGTLVVIHVTTIGWTYYYVNYNKLTESAYKHITDFKNILKTDFSKIPCSGDRGKIECLCKDLINKKSKLASSYSTALQGKDLVRAVKLNNGNYVSIIGKEDGKTIYHCSPDQLSNMKNKISQGAWKVIDGFLK